MAFGHAPGGEGGRCVAVCMYECLRGMGVVAPHLCQRAGQEQQRALPTRRLPAPCRRRALPHARSPTPPPPRLQSYTTGLAAGAQARA